MKQGVNKMKRVLIVEDEVLIAAEIEMYLEEQGFQVVGHCIRGKHAIELIADLKPDIVLLDIALKDNVDGIEVAQYIRANHDIPFVFLTSHSDAVTLEKAYKTSPYGYIDKPFNEKELMRNIRGALLKHAAEK